MFVYLGIRSDMKKILYLHGLESPQGGEKVDFLATKSFVHAPDLDYTRADIFDFLIKTVNEFKPDYIQEAWEHWYHKIIDYFYIKSKFPKNIILIPDVKIKIAQLRKIKIVCPISG